MECRTPHMDLVDMVESEAALDINCLVEELRREPGALQNADIKILDFGLARPLVAMSGSVHGGTVRALASASGAAVRLRAGRC